MGSERTRVAVGSDTVHETAGAVVSHLEAAGYAVVRCGAAEGSDTPWPVVAEEVARLVAAGSVATAVLCCWTGTGVSIAANKVPGVRAALCGDPETARGARRWNDANVLAIGLNTTSVDAATAIVDAWLDTHEVDGEELTNIEHLTSMERRYSARPDSAETGASQ